MRGPLGCWCLVHSSKQRVEPAPATPEDGKGAVWAADGYSGGGFKYSRQQEHPLARELEDLCPRSKAPAIRKQFARSKTLLGEGGFAKVWLGSVRHRNHNSKATGQGVHASGASAAVNAAGADGCEETRVAIKVTLCKSATDRFEAELLAFLGAASGSSDDGGAAGQIKSSHANIVELLAVYPTSHKRLCMVFE